MHRDLIFVIYTTALLTLTTHVFAGGGVWLGDFDPPNNNWDVGANWEHGVPELDFFGFADDAFIVAVWADNDDSDPNTNNGPIIDSSMSAVAGQIILGWNDGWVTNPGDTVTLTMTGGTLELTSDFWIGKNDPAGTVFSTVTGPGILDISGGDITLGGGTGHLVVGQGAEGTVNQTGGSVTTWRLVLDWFGNDTGGSVPSIYNLHGGTLEMNDATAPIHLRPGSLLDIADGGVMTLAGDHTATILDSVATDHISGFGGTGTVLFDFDVTNPGMTTVWAELAAVETGDFDQDSDVDGADFLAWQRGHGIPVGGGATRTDGDANGDGGVNGDDLAIWENQFGPAASLAAVAAVPEPSAILLLAFGGALLVGCRGKK